MDKQILNFTVNEQVLVCENPIKISTNKVNYIQAHFDLGENWDGFDSVRAVWFNDFNCISTVLDSLGNCAVPFEVMKRKGNVKVNLVGSISEDDVLTDRLTSYPVVAVIVDCTAQITGANTSPITPSEYEQFVAAVHEDADRAEQSASSAQIYAGIASNEAESAHDSAESAHDDKIAIEQAIAEVIQQIEDFEQVQVVVNTLPPTSPATSDFTDGVLTLGIPQGVKGDTGNGIQSITKVSTSGLVDTYRITYTNGQTTTFTVTNGAKGDTGNGISSIEKTSTVGLVDTYTITYTDGTTTTFTVTNGEKGDKGDQGEVSLSELEDATVVQTLSDNEPYNHRRTNNGNGSGHREYDEIVGASVAWNQLVQNGDFADTSGWSGAGYGSISVANNVCSYTLSDASGNARIQRTDMDILANHKYFISMDVNAPQAVGVFVRANNNAWQGSPLKYMTANAWSNYSVIVGATADANIMYCYCNQGTLLSVGDIVKYRNIHVHDLTLFNSAIADYVYSLEQSTVGSGVSWLKSHFPKLFDNGYMSCDSGSIKSVSGLTAHVMCDANDNIIGNYPLDSSVELRGQYKLNNGQLYAVGDVWKSSGEIDRNWSEEVDLGSLNWSWQSTWEAWYTLLPLAKRPTASVPMNGVSDKYLPIALTTLLSDHSMVNRFAKADLSDTFVIRNGSDSVQPSGHLVYELATPTTETATPYTSPQWCDSHGTEEYVGSELPVGHNTDYPMSLVDTMPTTNGTFEPRVTVTNGVRTVTWVSV